MYACMYVSLWGGGWRAVYMQMYSIVVRVMVTSCVHDECHTVVRAMLVDGWMDCSL